LVESVVAFIDHALRGWFRVIAFCGCVGEYSNAVFPTSAAMLHRAIDTGLGFEIFICVAVTVVI
jgi:hypothetical protein